MDPKLGSTETTEIARRPDGPWTIKGELVSSGTFWHHSPIGLIMLVLVNKSPSRLSAVQMAQRMLVRDYYSGEEEGGEEESQSQRQR